MYILESKMVLELVQNCIVIFNLYTVIFMVSQEHPNVHRALVLGQIGKQNTTEELFIIQCE